MYDQTIPVRVTYDESADAAYIYLTNQDVGGEVAETVPMNPLAVDGMINLDFGADGRLIGVEVLDASKRLPLALLKSRVDGD